MIMILKKKYRCAMSSSQDPSGSAKTAKDQRIRKKKEEAQTSGCVDQPGDYLNLLTFSARTPWAWSC